MHKVEPQVFLVGETKIIYTSPDSPGLTDYLKYLETDWNIYDDESRDAEDLIEVMGRLCYRSFEPGLNPNVTKITEGNKQYLENIIKHKHGSVLEHSVVNFIFADVSRVFTHELVRHRVGTAISQESLRYVRLEDLGQWLPKEIKENEMAKEIFEDTFIDLEIIQKRLAELFDLDHKPFEIKKKITSAMRRLAPIGLSTTIGWSTNLRNLRWILEMRTHPNAEEEMRLVFGKVGKIVVDRYKNVFGDFSVEMVDGYEWYKTENSKI